jgi:hypothetical protein
MKTCIEQGFICIGVAHCTVHPQKEGNCIW